MIGSVRYLLRPPLTSITISSLDRRRRRLLQTPVPTPRDMRHTHGVAVGTFEDSPDCRFFSPKDLENGFPLALFILKSHTRVMQA